MISNKQQQNSFVAPTKKVTKNMLQVKSVLKVNRSARNFGSRKALDFAIRGCNLQWINHINICDAKTGRWHAVFEAASVTYRANPTEHGFQVM